MKWPLIAPDWYFMVVYDDTAIVMKKMLTSAVVMMFMRHGWPAVFSMTHCLMQIDGKFGLHKMKLASCNLHGKSFLSLIGFINTYNQFAESSNSIQVSCSVLTR
jgi:hypothetical protein